MNKFHSMLLSGLLLSGCSQLPEPVSPKSPAATAKSDVLECKPEFVSFCHFDRYMHPHCVEVSQSYTCSETGSGGGGGGQIEYTYRQFRVRSAELGSVNFNVTYQYGSVLGITSTRQPINNVTYEYNGFIPGAEYGDGSFDFIALITLTDNSLPSGHVDRIKIYQVSISYNIADPNNIAQITAIQRVN